MNRSQPQHSYYKHALGLTLIELMISIAIMSILITAVGPMVRDILIQNRLIGQINELSAVVQLARHSAINEQVTSIICPSSDFTTCNLNWDLPKMVFLDLDGNGVRDANEELLGGTSRSVSNYNLTGPAGIISFQGNGATATPSTLLLCHESNEAQFARAITISLQGRVRVSQDTNNDGIYETNAGANLSCL